MHIYKFTLTLFVISLTTTLCSGYTYYYDYSLNYVGVYADGATIKCGEAEEYCNANFGTSLVSVHDATENANVRSVADSSGASAGRVCIGLNDVDVEGTYVWTDDTPFDYSNWASGEPNNYYGTASENCIDMREDGTWNDFLCANNYGQPVYGMVCYALPPTSSPTNKPSSLPSDGPTGRPSSEPTNTPSEEPTSKPSNEPTTEPTSTPSKEPTTRPSDGPTVRPTGEPTEQPTEQPTEPPTVQPSEQQDVVVVVEETSGAPVNVVDEIDVEEVEVVEVVESQESSQGSSTSDNDEDGSVSDTDNNINSEAFGGSITANNDSSNKKNNRSRGTLTLIFTILVCILLCAALLCAGFIYKFKKEQVNALLHRKSRSKTVEIKVQQHNDDHLNNNNDIINNEPAIMHRNSNEVELQMATDGSIVGMDTNNPLFNNNNNNNDTLQAAQGENEAMEGLGAVGAVGAVMNGARARPQGSLASVGTNGSIVRQDSLASGQGGEGIDGVVREGNGSLALPQGEGDGVETGAPERVLQDLVRIQAGDNDKNGKNGKNEVGIESDMVRISVNSKDNKMGLGGNINMAAMGGDIGNSNDNFANLLANGLASENVLMDDIADHMETQGKE